MTRRRGFTLIELLIVVAIIGIIVAISAVNMFNAIQRAKQKRSMGDMRSLATAIEAYATNQNFYPAAAGFTLPSGLSLPTSTLGAIPASLSPTYLRVVPIVDGWSSYFHVRDGHLAGRLRAVLGGCRRGPRDGSGLGPDDEFQRRHHPRRQHVCAVSGRRSEVTGAPARQTVAQPPRLLRQNFVPPPAFQPDSCLNQPDSGSGARGTRFESTSAY